ncbi:argininosuccinate lyase [Spongiivirga citrea]|uniref:Argininosuccinate lyase n=1 Tax=Spongiivirga citrea TaxID=1481457 RepID=A0A6M0CEZ4_9FLAO|nr:argininosuccinate lyase [Spongiivirga citrea]NER16396.1 argininosuccinate lyase [Spongiivirga citrea]
MKLWDKGIAIDYKIEAFTVGNDRELDMHIAKYDIIASKAHATMLQKVSLISEIELHELIEGLDILEQQIEDGTFIIEAEFEDVHSKIEYFLTEKYGEAGKKIHTARSRNDQVLTALHLYVKESITDIKALSNSLFNTLMEKAAHHKDDLLPGYTHLQVAMPSSFGLWFSAYAESLIDDLYLLEAAYKIADQNPLGSAAGYGSSFPIDRALTTELLDFDSLKVNVVAAQMGRGKLEKSVGYAVSSIAGTLSKMAMDVCLYNSQNFGFIKLSDAFTTGSSIMPHKKNPDVFELIRGKCNVLQSLPNQIMLLTTNLPSGYHRDLQLLKELLVPAISTLKECLEITNYATNGMEVKNDIAKDSKYDDMYSVESLNQLVQEGYSFRDAYKMVGNDIFSKKNKPTKQLSHSHIGSLGNLRLDLIQKKYSKL